MNELLTWWRCLLMLIGLCTVLVFMAYTIEALVSVFSKACISGKKKFSRMEVTNDKLDMLRTSRMLIYEMCLEYDRRHGLEMEEKESSFNWFFNKYTLEELYAMDGCYCLSDLYTEEELLKIGS